MYCHVHILTTYDEGPVIPVSHVLAVVLVSAVFAVHRSVTSQILIDTLSIVTPELSLGTCEFAVYLIGRPQTVGDPVTDPALLETLGFHRASVEPQRTFEGFAHDVLFIFLVWAIYLSVGFPNQGNTELPTVEFVLITVYFVGEVTLYRGSLRDVLVLVLAILFVALIRTVDFPIANKVLAETTYCEEGHTLESILADCSVQFPQREISFILLARTVIISVISFGLRNALRGVHLIESFRHQSRSY